MIDLTDDIRLANNVRKKAYSPQSGFTVGAVLMAKNGKRYTGCNIENQGIQSICAERVAFCKAISEGEFDFERIVVVGGKKDKEAEKCLPCGYCRQFMSEFVDKDFKIYTVYENKVEEYTMEELLPYAFQI
ncbi:MAG: cytidine deaminase [Clostridia bacterium]|nr:cytidine deaminase [Clostridia bacterium]